MRILVTRPAPDGERTATALRARGHDVLVAPLLRVETIAADLDEGPFSALAFTSANAARAIKEHPRYAELVALPAFAVGARTAEALRAAGFGNVISAQGDVNALARLIVTQLAGKQGSVLYLAGEDRSGDLAGDLAWSNISASDAEIYRAVAETSLPPPVRDALAAQTLDGVLHFSRRSAQVFLDCAKAAGLLDRALAPTHYCLSRQVADPLAAVGAAAIRVAPRPEEAALIALIANP
jgi:uroporphyrinogen-III synthase